MASPMVQSNKNMKRLQSRKSHSWWWDSHVGPKNSKWLAENLEEMDRSVRRMLKLIEEDGDSFAKKAEMYYQKRPELVSLVEEFYRMYRSLAERYDHVTGELKKNIPLDLQSQSSGISDVGSESTSTLPSPAPELRLPRAKPRAAGFDFFLGSGGSSFDLQKEGDETSTLTDSESESDDSSVNNYSGLLGNGGDNALSRKVIELEIELREMKDRLLTQHEENGGSSHRGVRNEHFEDLLARIAGYEQELKIANQSIQLSKEEVARLNVELHRYKSLESTKILQHELTSSTHDNVNTEDGELESKVTQASILKENIEGLDAGTVESNSKIQALEEELRITKEKLQNAEKEIDGLKNQLQSDRPSEKVKILQDQLSLAQKDINTWKTKLNAEKREVSKLHERIARLKTSLSDRDHEVRDLKIAVSDAEQKIFPEKANIKAEISKLLEERASLEEQLRESESRGRSLEDDIRKLQIEKSETEERHNFEINQRHGHIENLNKSLASLKLERDELNAQVIVLKADVISREDQIDQMDKHLRQLHMEHVKLIAGAEEARKLVDKLRSKANDMEKEVERQTIVIAEGAEEKREAIRQLCFSLEHYRNGYHRLRQAFMGHKRLPVLAA